MSRRSILIIVWAVMLVGVIGVSDGGYRYFTKRKPAEGTFQLSIPEGVELKEVLKLEEALIESDELLKGVINDLDLTSHWGHDSVEESRAHMRKSLLLQPGGEKNMLRVIYLDRNQKMALTILKAISDRYVEVKKQQHLLSGPAGRKRSTGGVR